MNLTPWLLIAVVAVPVAAVLFFIERPELGTVIIGLAITLEVLVAGALIRQAIMSAVMGNSTRLQFSLVRRVIPGLVLIGMSLFVGFVGVVITGAVAPKAVRFGGALACSGTVVVESTQYSYKPGQRGVKREFYCLAADGSTQTITGKTFVYSSLLVAAAALVALVLLYHFVGNLLLRRLSLVTSAPKPLTVTTDGRVSGGARIGEVFEGIFSQDHAVGTDSTEDDRSTEGVGNGRANVEERLAILERLYRSGLVTPDEYNAKRAEILADL